MYGIKSQLDVLVFKNCDKTARSITIIAYTFTVGCYESLLTQRPFLRWRSFGVGVISLTRPFSFHSRKFPIWFFLVSSFRVLCYETTTAVLLPLSRVDSNNFEVKIEMTSQKGEIDLVHKCPNRIHFTTM